MAIILPAIWFLASQCVICYSLLSINLIHRKSELIKLYDTISTNFVRDIEIDRSVTDLESTKLTDKLITLLDKLDQFQRLDSTDYYITTYNLILDTISRLESKYVRIQTSSFLSFALMGRWKHRFSNYKRLISPRISIEIDQEISESMNSNGRYGNITCNVTWPEWQGMPAYSGELLISSSYNLTSEGDLSLDLQGHVLKAEREIPADVEELIGALQGAIPFDLFDPTGSVLRHTFIAPNLRIVRVRQLPSQNGPESRDGESRSDSKVTSDAAVASSDQASFTGAIHIFTR